MTQPTIYAIGCTCHDGQDVRYVGQTTRPLQARFAEHVRAARRDDGSRSGVHRWMSWHGQAGLCVRALEVLPEGTGRVEVLEAETRWMRQIRRTNFFLLNSTVYHPRPKVTLEA